MKTLYTFLALTLVAMLGTPNADAAYRRMFQDVKFPTQQMIEFQEIDNPLAATSTTVLNGHAGATSAAAVTVTSFAGQPDVPRNLVITPGGTTTDVESCTITVTGTNINSDVISEDFVFAADASTAATGAKAFKTVTSIAWAASCESGGFAATWSVGLGEKIGLKRCMDNAGFWLHSSVAGVKEATEATITADADEVEKNTANFNGTMNGTNDFDAFFIQNYNAACQP